MDISADTPKSIGKGPRTRVCYVCGRQYGLSSYEIHLKQCKDLWIAREALKDPKERKPLPLDPMLQLNSTSKTSISGATEKNDLSQVDLDEINRIASSSFNTNSLSTCEHCGRSFLPEKLIIHNRSCTSEKPARRVNDPVNRKYQDSPGVSNSTTELPILKSTPSSRQLITGGRPSTSPHVRNRIVDDDGGGGKGDDNNNVSLGAPSDVLVGTMGGPSGRSFRSTGSPRKKSVRIKEDGDQATPSSKDEVVAIMTKRLDEMESVANDLFSGLQEMRQLLIAYSKSSS